MDLGPCELSCKIQKKFHQPFLFTTPSLFSQRAGRKACSHSPSGFFCSFLSLSWQEFGAFKCCMWTEGSIISPWTPGQACGKSWSGLHSCALSWPGTMGTFPAVRLHPRSLGFHAAPGPCKILQPFSSPTKCPALKEASVGSAVNAMNSLLSDTKQGRAIKI